MNPISSFRRWFFATRCSRTPIQTRRPRLRLLLEHLESRLASATLTYQADPRTRLAIERVELSSDGRSVDLTTAPLVRDRVYMIQARGVRSAEKEMLVQPAGAYTMNEVPITQR